MIAPLAPSWVVVVEVDEGPGESTLEAFGPFAGDRARERAVAFGDSRQGDEVLSVAVLSLRPVQL